MPKFTDIQKFIDIQMDSPTSISLRAYDSYSDYVNAASPLITEWGTGFVSFQDGECYLDLRLLLSQFPDLLGVRVPINNSFSVPVSVSSFDGGDTVSLGDFEFLSKNAFAEFMGFSVSAPSLPSLNGDYHTFKDGSSVTFLQTGDSYIVVRSYFVFASASTCTPMYEIVNDDNNVHFVPHDALTLVV